MTKTWLTLLALLTQHNCLQGKSSSNPETGTRTRELQIKSRLFDVSPENLTVQVDTVHALSQVYDTIFCMAGRGSEHRPVDLSSTHGSRYPALPGTAKTVTTTSPESRHNSSYRAKYCSVYVDVWLSGYWICNNTSSNVYIACTAWTGNQT